MISNSIKCNGNYEIAKISKINKTNFTYKEFHDKYLSKNIPCIITSISDSWNCTKDWIVGNEINFSYLSDKYGNSTVPVADCGDQYYNSQRKFDMTIMEYSRYWTDVKVRNYPSDLPLYYLKDWHFKKEYPLDNIYEIPEYFSSDWLNEYLCDNNKDDYKFVYIGLAGTWTPFHADVFKSYSWSTNIIGLKRWLLFPPGQEEKLKDKLGNLPFDVLKSDYLKDVIYFEIFQKKGEAIFVPSNWHHQVWNIEDTISINHNWFNRCNINIIWTSLKINLMDVKKELSDVKDMENFNEQCQVVLNASFGMDYVIFYNLLKHIANKRIDCLNKNNFESNTILDENNCKLDLLVIKAILDDFILDADATNILWNDNYPSVLLTKIIHVLGK